MATTQPHGAAHDHGHSGPAWATVAIIAIGTLVCAFSFPLHSPPLFWAGAVVIVLGLVVGNVWARSRGGALPSYTDTTPIDTNVEGPTRSSTGTNRP